MLCKSIQARSRCSPRSTAGRGCRSRASVGSILQSAAVGAFALTGDQTIGAVTQLNSDNGQVPIGCTDGSAGWAFFYNGVAGGPGPNPGKNVYYATPGWLGRSIAGTFDMFGKMPTRMVTTRASGALKIYANGTLGGSGTVAGTIIGTSTEVLQDRNLRPLRLEL